MKIYINGDFFEKENAKISVFDHGLLYGDGIFEGIRIYNGKIFKLKEHLERLYKSAKAIMLTVPLSFKELEKAVQDTVHINKKENGYIRLVITRGNGTLGIDPTNCKNATVIIIVDDIQLYPKKHYQKGIKIITASVRRISPDSLDPRIKSLNYLNNIMAKMEAENAGCLEAVMLNKEGFVAECTGDNIFIVKNKCLLTPSGSKGALDGITKNTVMHVSKKIGLPAQESELTQYDLYTADECFLTGTGAEIIPVIQIDGRAIGNEKPGPITQKLTAEFN
ncbi:MAG: branched-chain-amino-acid transaminase [Deltaproteobacteria bacterium]|nr:branched-chain-amino-acid transaminase [Deltaproteobacteria bacterium]MBW1846626.1 branched-chain-amino-acid transaminase [Deltaproteobacteria bacterium]MBW2364394.1 branched-chain-amino-acid transaminase [Deltaproteobacteria bacterium]